MISREINPKDLFRIECGNNIQMITITGNITKEGKHQGEFRHIFLCGDRCSW